MERNRAIDILKFFAVLLIVNSHFDEQYVCCKELATGGAIGDALFFFCSGYTLFLGRLGRFDEWYKRRIRRIYPSVIALAFITALFCWDGIPFLSAMFYNAGWFVGCIMIYYVLLYFIRKYAMDRIRWVYGISIAVVLCWYTLFFEPIRSWIASLGPGFDWLVFCLPMDKIWIYQWNYFKWGFFFLFMLMGAGIGIRNEELGMRSEELGMRNEELGIRNDKVENQVIRKSENPVLATRNVEIKEHPLWKQLGWLLLSTITFYALPLFIQVYPEYKGLLIFSLIPLACICMSFYYLCKTEVMQKLLDFKYVGTCIAGIGGLCLEIYLVQPIIRTTALNYLFPLNLVILFFAIVIVAYLCRVLGRFFQQTFSAEDGYNWKEVFQF